MTDAFLYQPTGPLGAAERAEADTKRSAALAEASTAAATKTKTDRETQAAFHTVTVTTLLEDAGTEDESRCVDRVTFACTAPDDASCRTYPECGCESFEWNDAKTHDVEGHPLVSGRPCWIKDWFDANGAVYSGPDEDDYRDDQVPAFDRIGNIVVTFEDDYITWDWATPPEPQPAPVPKRITLRDIDNRDDEGAPYEFTGFATKIISYLNGPLRRDLHNTDGLDQAIKAVRDDDLDAANVILNPMSIYLSAIEQLELQESARA